MWSLPATDGAALASGMQPAPTLRPQRHLRLVSDEETPPPAEVYDLPGEWAVWMRAAGRSERTITDRLQLLARASKRVGEPAGEMTTRGLVAFLGSPMSAGTRATYYAALRAWHRWLMLTGNRGDDPTVPLARPRAPRRTPRPVSNEGLAALLRSRMKRRTRVMVLLAAYQGLRVHEIAKLRGEDVDLIGRRLRVVGKGGLDAMLPLHSVIAEQARVMPRRGWWFPAYKPNRPRPDGEGPVLARSVSTVISIAMRRAEVPGTAHCLRHWHGTQLLRTAKADARVTQTLLRHASLATTAIYTEVDADDCRDALERLPRFDA